MARFPFLATLIVLACLLSPARAAGPTEDDFDRLDGTGTSGKTVNVIEWEGNLEVHVYPAGSLAGLGLKLDHRDKNKPVMVLSYRFDHAPDRALVRRAILSIPLREGFRTYKDPSASDYDKIIVTNHQLPGLLAFKADVEPKQLYPDGHPALGEPSRGVAGQAEKKTPPKHAAPAPRAKTAEEAEADEGRAGNFSF